LIAAGVTLLKMKSVRNLTLENIIFTVAILIAYLAVAAITKENAVQK
jgi:hypothetical protein